MKKYNIDQSLMEISTEDKMWAYKTVFSQEALELKCHLDQHYLQYFPPIEKKLFEKVAVLNYLNLRNRTALNILDISTGCGHLITLLNSIGHKCQGTEILESIKILQPLYNFYKIDVSELHIKKFKEIDFPKKFDMIITIRTVFDDTWGNQEWSFFKKNMLNQLSDNGELFIKTNIKSIPQNWNKHLDSLGTSITGWNSLTYHFKK